MKLIKTKLTEIKEYQLYIYPIEGGIKDCFSSQKKPSVTT